jgi:YbbR domain-containing protein
MISLKDLLSRNWFAKVLALVLAILLWVTISSQANSEIGIVIPLEYRNIPPQLEIIDDTANTVEVRLRGPATLIREVSPQDISATVELSGLGPGDKIVQLTSQNIRAPFGVEVVRVNPSQVRLNIDRTITRNIPVVVQVDGSPAAGFEIAQMTVTPTRVDIQGPESKIQPIETIPTALVRLNGRKASFTQSVDLDLPDPMVRLQYLSPVEVRVMIVERGSAK